MRFICARFKNKIRLVAQDIPCLLYTSETIGAWPENEYTESIPRPEYGTPDFILSGESDGCDYYSVFLSGITREQGEQYVSALKEAGFREIAADSEPASAGIALCKDTIHLSLIHISLRGTGQRPPAKGNCPPH